MRLIKSAVFVILMLIAFSIIQSQSVVFASQDAHENHVHKEEAHGHADHAEKEESDDHCQGSSCKETHQEDTHLGEEEEDHHDEPGHEGHGHEEHGAEQEEAGHEEHGEEQEEGAHEGHGHEEHGEEHEEGGIELDAEARGMIELKTAEISKRNLKAYLKVYGKIARDTENYSYVTFDGDGVVESIDVKMGEIVDEGVPLLTIQRNDGSVERVLSEGHGTIFSIFVKPSERVDKMTSLLSLIDLDVLKATVDVYEKDLRLVKVGQKVLLTTAAYPEKKFSGEVVYISPQVDEHTQAIQVRVDVKNQDHLLRLGMFISGELLYSSDDKVLAVPNAAIQQLDGEEVVFVQGKPGHYERRDVSLGRNTEEFTEIKKGLMEGEIVVTHGSFYLKSEIAKESFGDGHNH